MSPTAKVPRTPRRPVGWEEDDFVNRDVVLWRIHRTSGPYPTAWSSFRSYGPLPSMRWDPHPEPVGVHDQYGVLYTAYDLKTATAEVFQQGRRIDTLTAAPYATSWTPTRPLRLLDLTGLWPLRQGASHALLSAPEPSCRNWARAICDDASAAGIELDGLEVHSTLTGEPMAVLFAGSGAALPAAPAYTSPLDGPMIFTALHSIASDIGYSIT